MFFSARAFLQRQFDASLAARAQSFASMLRMMPDGRVTLEHLENTPAGNGTTGRAELYEVWGEDGSVRLARRHSAEKIFRNRRLPKL